VAQTADKLWLIGINSYGATELAEALQGLGADRVSVPQGWKRTPASAWVERRLADAVLRHSGSRLRRWKIGTAVVTRQANAISVSKASAVGAVGAGTIDGVAARLNAAAAICSGFYGFARGDFSSSGGGRDAPGTLPASWGAEVVRSGRDEPNNQGV